MEREMESMDEYSQRLRYARSFLVRKITQYETYHGLVQKNWNFLLFLFLGLGSIVFGLLLLWMTATGFFQLSYTLLGREIIFVPPIPFVVGVLGLSLTIIGCAFLPWAVNVRLHYASKLHNAKETLKKLDEFLNSPRNLRTSERAIQIIRGLEQHLKQIA